MIIREKVTKHLIEQFCVHVLPKRQIVRPLFKSYVLTGKYRTHILAKIRSVNLFCAVFNFTISQSDSFCVFSFVFILQLSSNPYLYDNHVALINNLRQLGELDALREARQKMSEIYPLSEGT